MKIFYVILAYLCGSIPFAYIIARLVVNVDIRSVGSGNPGATNVLRTVGKFAGIVTFIADTLKGFIPVYFAMLMDASFFYLVIIAGAVILGHIFSIFLNFQGGKGVATALGVFLVLVPLPSLIALSIFVLVFIFSNYVALASICAAVGLPLASYFLSCRVEATIFAFVVAILIIYKHKTNIERLKNGTEYEFRIFKKKTK
jgi:glycerol-3-phosphate acyltransferase PlsY